MFTILWFLLVLSFLVIIHELGHFFAAKWAKVHVEEFGLGYPPRVKKLFRWWNTWFSLNVLPFGGFVKLYGDDVEPMENEPSPDGERDGGKFADQPGWKRLIIILAGVTINFIFGVVAFAFIFSQTGIPQQRKYVLIDTIAESSPAQASGIQVGEEIRALVSGDQRVIVPNSEYFIQQVSQHRGEDLTLVVAREGQEREVTLRARSVEETPEGQGALGVGLSDMEFVFYPWYEMPWRGMVAGLQDALALSGVILMALGDMVGQLVGHGVLPKDISGPVGIVDQASQLGLAKQGWLTTLNFAALLSVQLAIMNLLPIPALDGGRALFILLEPIVGRDRRRKWEQHANTYGFFFLVGLIVIVTIKDVIGVIR